MVNEFLSSTEKNLTHEACLSFKKNHGSFFRSLEKEQNYLSLPSTNIKPPLVKHKNSIANAELVPAIMRPWIFSISRRFNIASESVMAAALVAISALVAKKLAIYPARHKNWLVSPNLFGGFIAHHDDNLANVVSEIVRPLERLNQEARRRFFRELPKQRTQKLLRETERAALLELLTSAIKTHDETAINDLRKRLLQHEQQKSKTNSMTRYISTDASINGGNNFFHREKPGFLVVTHDLLKYISSLKYVETRRKHQVFKQLSSSSLFGRISSHELRSLKKTSAAKIISQFQLLVFPKFFPSSGIAQEMSTSSRVEENIFNIFSKLSSELHKANEKAHGVIFADAAQKLFNSYCKNVDDKILSRRLNLDYKNHLANYKELAASLALIFWILENPENIYGLRAVSFSATTQAIKWCALLEKNAEKIYQSAAHMRIASKSLQQKVPLTSSHTKYDEDGIFDSAFKLLST